MNSSNAVEVSLVIPCLNEPAYPLLISTYESIGRQAEARKISVRYEKTRKEVTEQ